MSRVNPPPKQSLSYPEMDIRFLNKSEFPEFFDHKNENEMKNYQLLFVIAFILTAAFSLWVSVFKKRDKKGKKLMVDPVKDLQTRARAKTHRGATSILRRWKSSSRKVSEEIKTTVHA